MRKPDNFVIYPGENFDSTRGEYWRLQGNNRVAKIFEDGTCLLSPRINGHPTFLALSFLHTEINIDLNIIKQLKTKRYNYENTEKTEIRIL